MRVVSYARIDDVPASMWDVAAPADFFYQRPFLKVMQDSAVESARYRFLLLLSDGDIVGSAVISAFTLRLDLLANDQWVRRLRRWAPALLDVPIVCCGIPASYGQHHLHLTRPTLAQRAVAAVNVFMEEWAEEERAGFLFWKEWNPSQSAYAALRGHGYIALPTLPDYRVRHEPADIATFLGGMRSDYRRKYGAAAALLRGAGPTFVAGPLQLAVEQFGPEHVDSFYDGYQCVMQRAAVRLETYPLAFFRALARSTVDARLLRLRHCEHDEALAALVIPSHSTLTFILTAKERAHYRAGLYTTLLQCIVLYGLRDGFREIRLGQTSDYAKGSVGAAPWRLETLIRIRTPWKHRLLDRFGTKLFPELETRSFSVFRNGGRTA